MWLDGTSASVEKESMNPIVCHRGYHHVNDDPSRPIENTIASCAEAWKRGFVHAECDVVLTADGDIILCHDSTFARLLLDKENNSALAHVPTNKLTASDLDSMRLLDGSKPPRLSEVLDCAARLSSGAQSNKQLVVEIKGSKLDLDMGRNCAAALCQYLESCRDELPFISVIMSFDVEAMRILSEWKAYHTEAGFREHLEGIRFLLLRDASNWNLNDKTSLEASKDLVSELQLDGLYCEYQPEMLDPSRSFHAPGHAIVGVWNRAAEQPDGLEVCDVLVSSGVQFVNSDLPVGLLENGSSACIACC